MPFKLIHTDNVRGLGRNQRSSMELGTPETLVTKLRGKVHHKHAQKDMLNLFTTKKKGKALVKLLIGIASFSLLYNVLYTFNDCLRVFQYNVRKHHMH